MNLMTRTRNNGMIVVSRPTLVWCKNESRLGELLCQRNQSSSKVEEQRKAIDGGVICVSFL